MPSRKAHMSSRSSRRVLVLAAVASLMAALDAMVVSSALTTIRLDLGNAGVFFLFASLFGAVFFLPQFLQTGLGHGPLEAALRLGP